MSPLSIAHKYRWNHGVPRHEEVVLKVPHKVIHECLRCLSGQKDQVAELLEQTSAKLALPITTGWVRSWKKTLLLGNGFVCLQTTSAKLTDEELRLLYCFLAKSIGNLNQRYGAFFDVKDYGLDHTKSAIPISKTRACSGFHTDSSAKHYSPEVVGLMCLQPASEGGDSLLANAANLYAWLDKHHRDCLQALSRPTKRDVITPGTAQTADEICRNEFPIIAFPNEQLHFRYMRYWITTAYQKLQISLPAGLHAAMDYIDQYLANREYIFVRTLSRGEMLFLNNRYLCHSRTAFTDGPDPLPKRTFVRTWIDSVSSLPNRPSRPRVPRAVSAPVTARQPRDFQESGSCR